jgi:hypothetical protein
MPISTFPRHDYDEDEYLLKPAGLRDTHSEGKVIPGDDPGPAMINTSLVSGPPKTVCLAPRLARVASNEHQAFRSKPHII